MAFNALLLGVLWLSILEIVDTDRRETIQAAIDRNDNLAIALEEYAEHILENADQFLKLLVRSHARNRGNIDLEQFVADHTIDSMTHADIAIADENGNVSATVHHWRGSEKVSVADREHFRVHRDTDTGAMFIGKPVIDRISGRAVPLTRRINRPDGSFAGVAMLLIEHPRFTSVLQDAKMRPLDVLSLVGLDGITRARLRGATPTAGEDIGKSPLFSEQARRPVGNYAAHGQVDGIKRLFSYRTLPEYRLIATVGTAEADVLAPHFRRRTQYFWGAGIASVLIAGFTVLLTGALTSQRRAMSELARSRARHLATFNQAAVGIAHSDLEGRCLEVNQKLCEITGYTREELVGRKFTDITHPDDVAASVEFRRQVKAARDPIQSLQREKRYLRKDGSIVWCLLTTSAVCDETGNLDYLAAIIQDITDKKMAERDRAQLAAIVESSNDAIISSSPETKIISSWNPAAERMFGWSAAEAIGRSVRIITPPEYLGLLDPLIQRTKQGEFVSPVEVWRQRKDGSRFEAQVSFSAVRNDSGEIVAVATIIRDITERREKEAIALKEKQFSDTMIESMPGIVYFYDEQGRFLRWNRNFSRVSGYSPEEIAAMHPLDFFRDEDKPLLDRKIREVFVRGASSVEAPLLAKDGTATPYFFTGKRLIFDGSACLIGMGIDIQEQKQAEAALRDYAERMRDLSRRLSEVEENERRNIHRELHDRIGASLSALKLDLSLIGGMLDAETQKTVGSRLQRAQQLTGETIARIRDVMGELRPPALDDFGLLAALRTHAQSFAVRLGIPVHVNGEEVEPRLANFAETALFRIAQEALTNIAKHARAREVVISLDSDRDRLTLVIADDGAGFDIHANPPRQDSWGLRTMRERAQAIGADLRIESAPGKGTRVIVEVPREAA